MKRASNAAALGAIISVVAGLTVTATLEGAPIAKKRYSPPPFVYHEVPDDAYREITGQLRTTPGMLAARGRSVSVQVNVDAFGNNIQGDAANEPTIAVDPTNPRRMVIGWRQFDTISSNFRQAGYAYTSDGGQSWTFPGVIEPGVFRSDPVLAVDVDGVFYYNSLGHNDVGDFVCHVFRSQDGGATWDGGTPAYGGDKQWMVIDRTDSVGQGNIYAYWTLWYSSCDGSFTRSTDAGDSYPQCLHLPNDPYWGTLDIASNGDLFIGGINGWDSDFVVTRSTNAKNAGQTPTFDQTRTVSLNGTVVFGDGPNPGGLLGETWIAVDRSDGPTADNIYLLASVDPPGGDPLDVMFSRSTDGGNTWSAPVRVNDVGTGYQWFGTMSVAPNGRIDVIWNDTRNAGGGYDSELYYSFSLDGGLTWAPGEALGPAWDPHLGWPNQQKVGDYYHMISDDTGADLAYAATYNGEQDVYYLRIGASKCVGDLDGDGDTDQADLGQLLGSYNSDDGGDLDGDGDTDQADLGILLGDYNCGA